MPQMPRAHSCGARGFGDMILCDRRYLEDIRLPLISVSRYLRGEFIHDEVTARRAVLYI